MVYSLKKRSKKQPSSGFAKSWQQTNFRAIFVLSSCCADFIERKQWSWSLMISHSPLVGKYWRIIAILQNPMRFDQKFCTMQLLRAWKSDQGINFFLHGAIQRETIWKSKKFFCRHFQTGWLPAVWRSAEISIWSQKDFERILQSSSRPTHHNPHQPILSNSSSLLSFAS